MSEAHPSRFTGGSITDHIRERIEAGIPGAKARVQGGGGHFTIDVEAADFKGKTTLEKQRLVYGTITDLMAGGDAPIHAVDTMTTRVPEGA
ncbi:MAG: BolA/IbaG family iron-sulfur metabolism protein [Deltaproteobacteria bacterium]|nr:BolA/IbaG family iron-sulfur metabolism protein [Deltaproteobacteria bacterium]